MAKDFDIAQMVTDFFIAALEKGTAPWRKPWVSVGGDVQLQRNFNSKRPYRSINQFLLQIVSAEKGYVSPYWVTFNGAKKLGGKVIKGEKSTVVVFWKIVENKKGERIKGKDGQLRYPTIPLLRYYRVFNTEQCEGLPDKAYPVPEPEPEMPEADGFTEIPDAQAIIDNMPNAPVITHNGHSAHYNPAMDTVGLPEPKLFESGHAYYSTAFHELVHSTSHSSRVGREISTSFGSEKYSKEELIAEMGAAMICGHAGIFNEQTQMDNSAAYVKGWLSKLKGEKSGFIISAAGKAQSAADYILDTKFAEDSDD